MSGAGTRREMGGNGPLTSGGRHPLHPEPLRGEYYILNFDQRPIAGDSKGSSFTRLGVGRELGNDWRGWALAGIHRFAFMLLREMKMHVVGGWTGRLWGRTWCPLVLEFQLRDLALPSEPL